MADLSDWLTEKQVTDLLRISRADVERYFSSDGLKSRRPGSAEGQQPTWVYDPATVEAIKASFDKRNLEANPRLRDLVFSNEELHEVYESLGYSPWLRERMHRLASAVRACCDPDSLATLEKSVDLDTKVLLTPVGAHSLEFELASCPLVDPNHEHILNQVRWDAAVKARTDLLRELQNKSGNFCQPEGNCVHGFSVRSLLHDGVAAVDSEQLPYEEKNKKANFDYLLWRIEVGIPRQDESDRPSGLAFAATEYLRASWMHNRFLTERLARDIFKVLQKDVGKIAPPTLWPSLMIGTVAVFVFSYFRLMVFGLISVAVTLWLILPIILRTRKADRLAREVDRVARELADDWFSGKVLAKRVERLYQLGGSVPSVLPALLELLP